MYTKSYYILCFGGTNRSLINVHSMGWSAWKNKFTFYDEKEGLLWLLCYCTLLQFFAINIYVWIVKSHTIIETFIVGEIIHFYLYIIIIITIFFYVVVTAPTATGQLSYTFVRFDLLYGVYAYILYIVVACDPKYTSCH